MAPASSFSAVFKAQNKLSLLHLDAKGKVSAVNTAFEKFTGVRATELKGKNFSTLLPKNSVRRFEKLMRELAAKSIVSAEFILSLKNGLPLECTLTLFKKERNVIAGVLQPFSNIDRLREEIDTVNRIADHNLKKLVKTNEKLQQARLAEEDALRAKQQFLTNISHELRTPLTGISGITQLLAKTKLNAMQKKYVDSILHSTENLVQMINELLDLSKIKSGKFDLEIQDFSLYDCLKNSVSAFSIISANKDITFNFSYDRKIPLVLRGDSLRIGQIVNNLLNNAFKFTSEGYIHLNVTLDSLANNIALVRFEVTDTGIGIEKQKLNAIFEEFKQAEAGTARMYGGTGLGLAICQHLVQMHEGSISVSSVPGEGSTFYFTLPLPVGKKIRQTEDTPVARLKGHCILVADDNMVNILVIENILRKEGVRVLSASDGKEAYKLFKEHSPDLVLLDLNMPRMDGYTLVQTLRSKEKTRIPVIAVTAGNPESVEKKCYESGFTDVIFKPFRNEDLVIRIEKYLNEKADRIRTVNAAAEDKKEGPDFSALESITFGESAPFNELLQSIIDNMRDDIPKLSAAIASKNYSKIYFFAHKLKTSYGYVGMKKEQEALTLIEKLASNSEGMDTITRLFEPVVAGNHKLINLLSSGFRRG